MTPKFAERLRLWDRLDGDPFSYVLSTRGLVHFRIRLHHSPRRALPRIPEGQSIAAYVTTRLPDLALGDWWWIKRQNTIEVCVRMTAALAHDL